MCTECDVDIIVLSHFLVSVTIAMMKHYDQKQVGKESYLAYTSTLHSITEGSQDRNLESGADA